MVRRPVTSVGALVPTDERPLITYGLIAVNLLVYFIAGAQAHSLTDPTGRSGLYRDWVLVPAVSYYNHEYYRLLTAAFLHLSPVHIAANMVSLFIVGPPLERLLGRWRLIAVYLLSALGGGVAVYVFGDALGPVAGASGAIFGLFGACLILVRHLGLDLTWLASTVVLNFVFTFAVPGISRLGHLGGFVVGVLCALVVGGWPSVRKRVPTNLQIAGLAGVFVLLCVAVLARNAAGLSLPSGVL